MKTIVVNKDGALTMNEVPKPRITSKQALVKMVCCGICNGTDAKLIHRKFKGFTEDMYPIMLGHEAVGEVVEVGSEVVSYKIGDKVLLPFVDADKELFGDLGSGWGGYSEYGVVNDVKAYKEGTAPECAYAQTVVPSFIDPVDSCMLITLREVLSSIKRFGITEGKSVVMFGCGPVGLTFIKLLKLLGAAPVIAFDIVDTKVEEAAEKGADKAFNSLRTDVREAVRAVCPDGVDFVLDAVGILSIINQSMELIKDAGRICCYGISPECSANIDWSNAPYNWQLHFQQFPSKIEEGECNDQIIAWIKDGKLDLKDYISDYFKFEDYKEAFDRMEKRGIAKKGIIVF